MSNVEKTAWKIQASCPQGRVLTIDQALVVANVLEEAGLLAPAPQIIRTAEELEELDPETVIEDWHEDAWILLHVPRDDEGISRNWCEQSLPAVVLATGESVRAAREALGGA